MSEINSSNFKKEHGDLAPDLVGVTELTSPYFFVPPSGNSAERPENCEPGTLRFNTDHGTLEVYRGDIIGWEQIQRRDGQYLGGGTGSNTGTGTRMCVLGGYTGAVVDTIDFITLSTFGNAEDFGDLNSIAYSAGAIGNSTRGFKLGGYTPGVSNSVNVFTFASKGDAVDSVNLSTVTAYPGECSNEIRGLIAGNSHPGASNQIQFIELSLNNNALDFGDLSYTTLAPASCASSTRGIFCGGQTPSQAVNKIEFVIIMTKGDYTDFGDMTSVREQHMACSNSTRGLLSGGKAPSMTNAIDFITMASTGNAIDFGDMTFSNNRDGASGSSKTRGIVGAGGDPGASPYSKTDTINSVEIATTGNAEDFGDLTSARNHMAGCSNGHGGL